MPGTSDSADRAARVLARLAGSLERDHPGAAASIREGLEETLTVQRLGLTGALERTLRTTNIIENLMGSVEGYTRRVKRWRGGQMIQRWVASALVEAEPRFRRCGATATYATWSAPWTRWPRPTVRLLTWRRIDDLGAETGSPPLAKFNNERDNPDQRLGQIVGVLALRLHDSLILAPPAPRLPPALQLCEPARSGHIGVDQRPAGGEDVLPGAAAA